MIRRGLGVYQFDGRWFVVFWGGNAGPFPTRAAAERVAADGIEVDEG